LKVDINTILSEGSIIDNRRLYGKYRITLKDILESLSYQSDGLKCIVGYFYLEGLILFIDSLQSLREIKILMGLQTTKLTKQELIKTLKEEIDSVELTKENIYSIALFHELIKGKEILKIRLYEGENIQNHERLHSKAYLFLRNNETTNLLDRYKAGIIGSSNLTPSGLIGNTELNVVITEGKDLRYLEQWYDELWKKGSEDFEKLKITEIITSAITQSKFEDKIKEIFIYAKPEEFFKILINYIHGEYLFEDWKNSKLMGFQQFDAIRCLSLFNEKNYRGVFLTSSVGLGKSYVACYLAKYFLRNKGKVLLIAPSGLLENDEQWPRYIKEFGIENEINILRMGNLQKNNIEFENIDLPNIDKNYSLIIVDESHNYRNEDAFRSRNLKTILDKNGDCKILFLTATPINTSLQDLISLVKIFYRKGSDKYFDKIYRDLVHVVSLISDKPYEKLTEIDKELIASKQEIIEQELFVKSTRATIKTSIQYVEEINTFTGINISNIPDPEIEEIVYSLDKKYKFIVDGIVDFISDLSAANLRIIEPEKGSRLGGFFKWTLYKRFESDMSSYYLTLKRILKKNELILECIEKGTVEVLEEPYKGKEVDVSFDYEYKQKMEEVIKKIKSKDQLYLQVLDDLRKDIKLITKEIDKLEVFLQSNNDLLFLDDKKLSTLLELIIMYKNKKLLIFTEYKDTLKVIQEFLKDRFQNINIVYVDASTKNKSKLINSFNNDENLRILITTDTLSEGYNITGTDIVINFDIPYNPVRLIQRIGRATRINNPKPIKVLNFRPTEEIDAEITLVERLKIRIEDIIRFVGIEYRIWFQREKELIFERRQKDVKIYNIIRNNILKSIRNDIRKGHFDKLEIPISHINPVLGLLQKAIKKYDIRKEDVIGKKIFHNTYTLLEGEKKLSVFYGESKSFNDTFLIDEIEEHGNKLDFEVSFFSEIEKFKKHLEQERKDELALMYYNDKTDKIMRNIKEIIIRKGYHQISSRARELIDVLAKTKESCGSNTESVLKELYNHLKSETMEDIDKTMNDYNKRITSSFTQKNMQRKLIVEDKPFLALGFIK
jgi:superfamily II DNA or RNA helicase